ncbi:uncharacterized protein RSE6_04654 [Rhynchosporium secalis]|uniref:Uncharacterized protein n=1 Tax=Rhynchosporium secalis TaxID=38038 RepID=A0A1E1M5U5_RHYSE|nr:uncharacterized protein RSE6_04654 [Rhynchosporium secalis]
MYAPAQQLRLETQVSSLHDLASFDLTRGTVLSDAIRTRVGSKTFDIPHIAQVGIFVRIKTEFSSRVPTRDLDAQTYLMFDRQNTDEDEITLILLRETASLGFILKDQ